jgi:hypothetical protein
VKLEAQAVIATDKPDGPIQLFIARYRLFQEKQQHDHRRLGPNRMLEIGGHVDPGSGLCHLNVIAQADTRFARHKEEHRRFRRSVFGEFLPLTEAKNDSLDLVILKNGPTQDSVRRRFGFLGKIEDVSVRGHGWQQTTRQLASSWMRKLL